MKKFNEHIVLELITNIDEQISQYLTDSLKHIEGLDYINFTSGENRCFITVKIKGSDLDKYIDCLKYIKKYFNEIFKPVIQKAGKDEIYFEINKKEMEKFNLFKSLSGINTFNI